MASINLDDVREGMELDADLVENGQTLIKRGAKLTEKHLRLCKAWGISSLEIKAEDADRAEKDFFASVPPDLLAAAEKLARSQCRYFQIGSDPDQQLYQIYLRRLVEGLMKQDKK